MLFYNKMNPDVWGPGLWTFIHTIAYAFPEMATAKDREESTAFLYTLRNVIPCPGCQEEYSKYISVNPPDLITKDRFIDWTIELHNDVNGRLNKKIRSREWVDNLYENKYSASLMSLFSLNNNWNNPINLFVIFLVLIAILFYLIYNKKWLLK
jgi:hypothetical protein